MWRRVEGCGGGVVVEGNYFGGTFQLVHGGVISWLSCGTLGGTDELGQSLGHIPHCIYENNLREREKKV